MTSHLSSLFYATKNGGGVKKQYDAETAKEVVDREKRLAKVEDFVRGLQIKLDRKKQRQVAATAAPSAPPSQPVIQPRKLTVSKQVVERR